MIVTKELEDFNMESDNDSDSDSDVQESASLKRKSKSGKASKKIKLTDDALPKLKKTKNKNDLYKQPTAEELNQLQETENLFNSNIFRLQIDELLSEINIKPKHVVQFDEWFKKFEKALVTLPEFKDVRLDEFKKCSGKKLTKAEKFCSAAVDYIKNSTYKNVDNISLTFAKPTSVFTYGGHKCISKYAPAICVSIPRTSFYHKDYLNFKYTIKKFYYTVYLMHFIKAFDDVKEVNLDYYLGNNWLPILTITPKYSDKVRISLFAVPQEDLFVANRFLPCKNNIKQDVLYNLNLDKFNTEGTYLYNSLLLHDFTLVANQKLIENTLRGLTNVLDALKMLIVWLTQRNLNVAYTGFTNDLLLYAITYLAVKHKINKFMSSYQVMRIFWSFMSNLSGEVLSVSDDYKQGDFENVTGMVLLDATGCYNVAAFLDRNVYEKVKWEATQAMKNLDNNRFDSFAKLFTTKMPVGIQYDAILKVKDDDNFKDLYETSSDDLKFKFYGFRELLIRHCIVDNLKRGLNQRAFQTVPLLEGENKEEVKKLTFGINLDPEHCANVIEKGPKQFEAGSDEFKEFWGSLAELRRFKDSSIYEAVYFEDVKTIQDKRLIFKKIVKFVMEEKLDLHYELNGDEMEELLKMEHVVAPFPTGSNEEATLKVKSLQSELSKLLRDLKMPLAITAVQGISDVFSYTDLYPPIPTNLSGGKKITIAADDNLIMKDNVEKLGSIPRLVSPVECVLQLALHSKWPKDLSALRAMKQVFNHEIAKLLKEEHNIKTTILEDCLDVFYKGLVFRLRLYHPKEVALLKKDLTSDGVTFYKDTEESLELERRLDVLPKIVGALNGIHQENPAFGPSTCLIKRWLRSQMLDDYHISDVVVNLLNAALFLWPDPYKEATLPQVAFIRFLKFISEYDFNFHPIVVNFNNELKNDELNEIETKFLQNRQNYSSLFIITPYDGGNSIFTKQSPTIDILRRISILAGETYKYLLSNIHGDNLLIYKPLFVPNLEGYNLIIHIKASLNPRKHEQIMSESNAEIKIGEWDDKADYKIPVTGFNPVEFYLKELRNNYSEYALFFHDFYGGNTIGALWKEKALEKTDFKISNINARKSSANGMSLNTDALIEDFYVLGDGLVETIEVVQNE